MNAAFLAMGQTFTVGRLFGIRIGVHASWLIVFALMTIALAHEISGVARGPAFALAAVCALGLFASVVVHELAHAAVARRFGVRTSAITLFLFGGVAMLEREPPTPKAETLIALAGPLASALLGGIAFGALALLERFGSGSAATTVASLVAYLALANLVLAAFNVIPAFPMDGGRVLRAALWHWRKSLAGATVVAALVSIGFAALLIAAGVVLMVATQTLSFAWYVVVGGFVMRLGFGQLREARIAERLERVHVCDVMEAAADGEIAFEGVSLASSANGVETLAAFRAGGQAQIAVVDDGRLLGWVRRERAFALVDRAA